MPGASAPAQTAGPEDYTLTITCVRPGVVYFTRGGARPNRAQGVILAQRLGASTIPTGQCAETILGVEGGVQLAAVIPTEAGTGSGGLSPAPIPAPGSCSSSRADPAG